MLKFGFILVCSMFLLSGKGYCNDSFYKGKSRGWHWYEAQQKEEVAKIAEEPADVGKLTPTEMVAKIRKDAEDKLHKAMIQPTEKNVMEYIKAQEKIGDRSEEFAKTWQRVVYKNVELDRTLEHPISNNALHLSRRDELERKREKIKKLSEEYGLMYFFKGECKYCKGFSSVVRDFAKTYNWELMPIQMGVVGLPEFKNAKLDNGISTKLGIAAVPALIAVHPKTGGIIPLAFGYVSEDEIEDRVDGLVTEKKLVETIR